MDDAKELAWRHFLEHCTQGRHHEAQRASVSQFVIAIASGLAALAGAGGLDLTDLPLTFLIIVLGLFGALFSAKQYERFRYHMEHAGAFRTELENLETTLDIRAVRKGAKERHLAAFRKTEGLRLHSFWVALHVFVALTGVALFLMAVFGSTPK